MRRWSVVYGGASVLPTVLAVWAVARGATVPALLLVLPALVITVLCLMYLRSTRHLTSPQRERTLYWESWGTSMAYVFAATLGGWIATGWSGHPWLERHQFWLALLIALEPRLPVTGFRNLTRLLTDKGLFVFLIALLQENRSFAVFAALAVGLSIPLQVRATWLMGTPGAAPRQLDAQRFSDGTAEYQGRVLKAWMSRAVLRERNRFAVWLYRLVRGPWLTPRGFDHRRFVEGTRQFRYDQRMRRAEAWRRIPPDLSLIHTLCFEGRVAAESEKNPMVEQIHATIDRRGAAAFHWTDLADRLLAMVRLAHRHPDPRSQRVIDLAEALITTTRAGIHQIVGQKEQALAELTKAWHLQLQHGLVNRVADEVSTQAQATLLAPVSQLMLPDQVLPMLEALLDEPRLVPLTRRMIFTGLAACHQALGSPDEAKVFRNNARSVRVRWRDYRQLAREDRLLGTVPTARRLVKQAVFLPESVLDNPAAPVARRYTDMYELDLKAAGHLPPMILASALPDEATSKLAQAGLNAWLRGGPAAGAPLLRQAADLLEEGDQILQAYLIFLDVGLAGKSFSPAAAYGDLDHALQLQQRLRKGSRNPDLRMTSGIATEQVVSPMIALLASSVTSTDDAWPADRAAKIFELSELARSRVLLELISERAAQEDPGDPMTFPELRDFLTAQTSELPVTSSTRSAV